MAEPKCPECGVVGNKYIVSESSNETSKAGDPWFDIAFCDKCGHVYGVFAKIVHSPAPKLPNIHL